MRTGRGGGADSERVKFPTLNEFINICKNGQKQAVVELKNQMSPMQIKKLIEQIKKEKYLNNTTFISFDLNNCLTLRDILPKSSIQFVTLVFDESTLKILARKKIDLDIEYCCLSKKRIDYCHSLGIKVNCWTLYDKYIAKHLENCGIDFISTNNLTQD